MENHIIARNARGKWQALNQERTGIFVRTAPRIGITRTRRMGAGVTAMRK